MADNEARINFFAHIQKELIMFTLYVEGIPSIKLGSKAEIPAPQGNESWKVVDAEGTVIAAYR